MPLEFDVVQIKKPENINFILGQTHFIKTIEDMHEALVTTVPGITFGLAFCEASQDRLIRWTGTDDALTQLAIENAQAIAAGHSFILFLGDGFFPINVMRAVRSVPEIVNLFCATANPTQVIVAKTEQGRGIMGVIDGFSSLGVEEDEHIAHRKAFLRMIGYKFS
ncbi:MAG: adenosine-specific kinase [Anaerolineae bacterium]|nr:adenosine-specific kinase [Anaerolineae bacterium]